MGHTRDKSSEGARTSRPSATSGGNGIARTPPRYGIAFADEGAPRISAGPGEGVIQRWKSDSLDEELDPIGVARVRGRALFEAEQEGEDLGEDATDDELAPYWTAADREDLANYRKLDALRERGLAEDVHHIIPRQALNAFYDLLTAEQKAFVGSVFGRTRGVGGYQGVQDRNARNALLSLRSNLVLGPSGAKRSDDDAHRPGAQHGASLDPNFSGPGQLDAVSAVLGQAYQAMQGIAQLEGAARTVAINNVLDLLLDAELMHADRQGKAGFWDTTIDYDAGRNWEQHMDQNRLKWRKKPA